MRRLAFAVLASMVVPLATLPATPVFAQQSQLPPALKAALYSGNAAAIKAALSTLSGGDAKKLATLTGQVATEAEKLLRTNPQAALNGLSAVLDIVNTSAFKTANPQAAAQAAAAAGRIIVSPAAQQQASLQVAGLITTVTAIVTTPSVFKASPSAAKNVLDSAVQASRSEAIKTVAPNLEASVMQTIGSASRDPDILAADPRFLEFIATVQAEPGGQLPLANQQQLTFQDQWVQNPVQASPN